MKVCFLQTYSSWILLSSSRGSTTNCWSDYGKLFLYQSGEGRNTHLFGNFLPNNQSYYHQQRPNIHCITLNTLNVLKLAQTFSPLFMQLYLASWNWEDFRISYFPGWLLKVLDCWCMEKNHTEHISQDKISRETALWSSKKTVKITLFWRPSPDDKK